MRKKPNIIPPICAKCAIPSLLLVIVKNNSKRPYPSTTYLAFTGIAKYIYSKVLGNNIPNASNMPNTAPEAPTTGVLYKKSQLFISSPIIPYLLR